MSLLIYEGILNKIFGIRELPVNILQVHQETLEVEEMVVTEVSFTIVFVGCYII